MAHPRSLLDNEVIQLPLRFLRDLQCASLDLDRLGGVANSLHGSPQSPTEFAAALRHMVTLFRQASGEAPPRRCDKLSSELRLFVNKFAGHRGLHQAAGSANDLPARTKMWPGNFSLACRSPRPTPLTALCQRIGRLQPSPFMRCHEALGTACNDHAADYRHCTPACLRLTSVVVSSRLGSLRQSIGTWEARRPPGHASLLRSRGGQSQQCFPQPFGGFGGCSLIPFSRFRKYNVGIARQATRGSIQAQRRSSMCMKKHDLHGSFLAGSHVRHLDMTYMWRPFCPTLVARSVRASLRLTIPPSLGHCTALIPRCVPGHIYQLGHVKYQTRFRCVSRSYDSIAFAGLIGRRPLSVLRSLTDLPVRHRRCMRLEQAGDNSTCDHSINAGQPKDAQFRIHPSGRLRELLIVNVHAVRSPLERITNPAHGTTRPSLCSRPPSIQPAPMTRRTIWQAMLPQPCRSIFKVATRRRSSHVVTNFHTPRAACSCSWDSHHTGCSFALKRTVRLRGAVSCSSHTCWQTMNASAPVLRSDQQTHGRTSSTYTSLRYPKLFKSCCESVRHGRAQLGAFRHSSLRELVQVTLVPVQTMFAVPMPPPHTSSTQFESRRDSKAFTGAYRAVAMNRGQVQDMLITTGEVVTSAPFRIWDKLLDSSVVEWLPVGTGVLDHVSSTADGVCTLKAVDVSMHVSSFSSERVYIRPSQCSRERELQACRVRRGSRSLVHFAQRATNAHLSPGTAKSGVAGCRLQSRHNQIHGCKNIFPCRRPLDAGSPVRSPRIARSQVWASGAYPILSSRMCRAFRMHCVMAHMHQCLSSRAFPASFARPYPQWNVNILRTGEALCAATACAGRSCKLSRPHWGLLSL